MDNRIFQDNENKKEDFDNEKTIAWSERDVDNSAKLIGLRAIKANDISTFYKYQAMETLERVLSVLPEEYYIAYRLEQDEEGYHRVN